MANKQYRCKAFNCNHLLAIAEVIGTLEIKCPKCKKINTFTVKSEK